MVKNKLKHLLTSAIVPIVMLTSTAAYGTPIIPKDIPRDGMQARHTIAPKYIDVNLFANRTKRESRHVAINTLIPEEDLEKLVEGFYGPEGWQTCLKVWEGERGEDGETKKQVYAVANTYGDDYENAITENTKQLFRITYKNEFNATDKTAVEFREDGCTGNYFAAPIEVAYFPGISGGIQEVNPLELELCKYSCTSGCPPFRGYLPPGIQTTTPDSVPGDFTPDETPDPEIPSPTIPGDVPPEFETVYRLIPPVSDDRIPYTPNGTTPNNPVPEPSTMLLLGIGLAGLAGMSRKKYL